MKSIFNKVVAGLGLLLASYTVNAQNGVMQLNGSVFTQQNLPSNDYALFQIFFESPIGDVVNANDLVLQVAFPDDIHLNLSHPDNAVPSMWSLDADLTADGQNNGESPGYAAFRVNSTWVAADFNVVEFKLYFSVTNPFSAPADISQNNWTVSIGDVGNVLNSAASTLTLAGRISANAISLPVKFANFDAKANGCNVALNWNTSEEASKAMFKVQRSDNGSQYETIATVTAKSTNGNRYNFVDANAGEGKNYYRIAAVGVDGNETFSTVNEVSVACNTAKFDVYPNPTEGYVKVAGLTQKATITVSNIWGQEVMRQEATTAVASLDLSLLKAGTYYINIIDENDQVLQNTKVIRK
jgi:hypothetical protein